MKKIVTLIVISIGLFIGIVLPSQSPNDVKYESRSTNKAPSDNYWSNITNSGGRIRRSVIDVNLGTSDTYYLVINKYLYVKVNELIEQYAASGAKFNQNISVLEDATINSAYGLEFGYSTPQPTTKCWTYDYWSQDSRCTDLAFNYDSVNDVYIASISGVDASNVGIEYLFSNSWSTSQIKIQIQESPNFTGWVDYIPYNTPYEVESGSNIISTSIDKTGVIKGDTYNVIINIDNPNQFKFDSVVIDNNQYKINTAVNTDDTGDEYIIKVPFVSDVSYGDIIHTIQKVILKHPTTADYDIVEVNQNVTISSQENFVTNVTYVSTTFDKTSYYLTDKARLTITISNIDNIEINGINFNDKMYTNFTLSDSYTKSDYVSTNNTYTSKQGLMIGNYTREELNTFFSTYSYETLGTGYSSTSRYLYAYDPVNNYYQVNIYNSTYSAALSYVSNVLTSGSYDNTLYRYDYGNWKTFIFDSNLLLINSTGEMNRTTVNDYQITNTKQMLIFNINGFSLFSDLRTTVATKLVDVATFWTGNLKRQVIDVDVNTPDTTGLHTLKLNYIQFKKTLDKTYYSNFALNKTFDKQINNPILLNDIVIDSFTLDKTLAFSDEKVIATLNLTNPRALPIESIYINNLKVLNYNASDSTFTSIVLEIPLNDFYFMNLDFLDITKLEFSDMYNGLSIKNSFDPDSSGTTSINIVYSSFASRVKITTFETNKSYYLYNENIGLTINFENPDFVKINSIKVNGLYYPLTMITSVKYTVNLPVQNISFGKLSMNIESIIFEKDLLTKEITFNSTFDYELYVSNDVADINLLQFELQDKNIYLYHNDQYFFIKISNPTNLKFRSATVNNKEYLNPDYDELNDLYKIPVAAITDPGIDKMVYTLNSLSFVNGDLINTKNLNTDLVLNVINPYSSQIDAIETRELNGFNNLIYIAIVKPLLFYVFPFIDYVSINHPTIMNLMTYITLITSFTLITFLFFKNDIKRLKFFSKRRS